MKKLGYPKYGKARFSGDVGQVFIGGFVYQTLGWIYRTVHQEHDFGIDGYADIVTEGNVTGQSIALQVKHGDSYYNKKTSGGIRYDGENKHLNYYLNCPVPVVLIVLNDDCTQGRWVEFKANITSQSKIGWWIEIPENNLLDSSVKQSWDDIAGPVMDHSEKLDVSWRVNQVLDKSDFGIYVVHKDDVLACDFSGIRDVIERLSRNKESLLRNRGSLEVLIAGYDDDPREACEIPEIRHWYSESIKAGIPWFYFLGNYGDGLGIRVLLFCCCDVAVKWKKNENTAIELLRLEQVDEWLSQNFENLNEFSDKKGIPEEIIKEMSDRAGKILRDSL